jgi:hypothetical protein
MESKQIHQLRIGNAVRLAAGAEVRKPQPGRLASLHETVLKLPAMKGQQMYIQKAQRISGREDDGKQSLPLPLTVREWLQADARILIKAAKAIAEMNEM